MSTFTKATVVAIHGAWADGSSWEPVIRQLQNDGFNVVAAPIPLTSLSEDAAALRRTIARAQGPVIVAGHAYAGAVVATANEERVKALVYVAALAPDEGETVVEVFYRDEAHPKAPKLAPDADGFIWMPDESFSEAFAQNATAEQIAPGPGQLRVQVRAAGVGSTDLIMLTGRLLYGDDFSTYVSQIEGKLLDHFEQNGGKRVHQAFPDLDWKYDQITMSRRTDRVIVWRS